MKTRQLIIAAAAGLISASPAWAFGGSYGEGTMWTDLIAARDEPAVRQPVATVSGPIHAAYEGDLFERLAMSHATRQRAQAAAGEGPVMAGEPGAVRLNRLDTRPYVSIYEQFMMRHTPGGRF